MFQTLEDHTMVLDKQEQLRILGGMIRESAKHVNMAFTRLHLYLENKRADIEATKEQSYHWMHRYAFSLRDGTVLFR